MCGYIFLEARTHRPIFRGFSAESVVELADSIQELADDNINFVIVSRLPLSNMFNILNPLESAEGNRLTIAVSRWSQLSGYRPEHLLGLKKQDYV